MVLPVRRRMVGLFAASLTLTALRRSGHAERHADQ